MTFQLKGQNMTSDEIKALLDQKYSDGDQCLIAFEVNEGTGSSSGRRIDALAMHLWPSKDYEIIGFEIKVSRSDWLNERKQPEKSMAISQFCDKFYLVAPEGVLGIDELPKTWGYIRAGVEGLYTKIKAPKRDVIPADRPFMASMIRSMARKYTDKKLLKAQVDKVRDKAEAEIERRIKLSNEHRDREIAKLRLIINEFKNKTGLEINHYNLGKISHLVNVIQDPKKKDAYVRDLNTQIQCQESFLNGTKKILEDLEAIKTIEGA